MTIAIVGNCQASGLANCLTVMLPGETVERREIDKSLADLKPDDWLIVQQGFHDRDACADSPARKLIWPRIVFRGFQPDIGYVLTPDGPVKGPMGGYQSTLIFAAWRAGLPQDETRALFRRGVFEALGYLDIATMKAELIARLDQLDYPGVALVEGWMLRGPFMHTINHPHMCVLSDIAFETVKKLGLSPVVGDATPYVADSLKAYPVWPTYPAIAEPVGAAGSYLFKPPNTKQIDAARPLIDLPTFIAASYAAFDAAGNDKLTCKRLEFSDYDAVVRGEAPGVVENRRARGNPYKDLPDHRFWRRAVAQPACRDVRPVIHGIGIARDEKIATAGSCFAQHLARALRRSGYRYYVAERPPEGMDEDGAKRRQYGVYSARYGNLYTARQLVQLFDRAYGDFVPRDSAWRTPEGRWVDPFRPEIEPDRFDSPGAVAAARAEHLASVREVFETLDTFVFTLGMTECWHARDDGAVFPLAPGVVAGNSGDPRYGFINLSAREVEADLRRFIAQLGRVNPGARVILTVSPVPIIATYEDRHVLVSTVYTKSTLRVAAQAVADSIANVIYFPGYEIVLGQHARGGYFEDDLRSVTREGVDHVMDVFTNRFAVAGPAEDRADGERPTMPATFEDWDDEDDDIICEEDLIGIGI